MPRSRPKVGRARKPGARNPRKTICVVTNGTLTEKSYFEWLKSCVEEAITVKSISSDPAKLVSECAKWMGEYDEVWAVCDVDEFRLDEACQAAKRSGVELLLSNPCFEVWLIDHAEVCAACQTASEAERRAVRLGLVRSRSHKGSTSKAKEIVVEALDGKIPIAIANASKHNTAEKARYRRECPDKRNDYLTWTDLDKALAALSIKR